MKWLKRFKIVRGRYGGNKDCFVLTVIGLTIHSCAICWFLDIHFFGFCLCISYDRGNRK